jgi:short-subunit dehydrogenase
MERSANGRRRMKIAAAVEFVLAGGFLAFWTAFLLTDMVDIADPRLREVYLGFESAFPPADILLAIVLASGGIGLLRGRSYGLLLTLAGGGALVFLGLLDVTFNVRHGIYGLGRGEAILNGIINSACLASGILLIRTIWAVPVYKDDKSGGRDRIPAREGRSPMRSIAGKRVFITGASSGIGRALALEFARKGARLALAGRTLGGLEEVACEAVRTAGGRPKPLALVCDVCDPTMVRAAIREAVRGLGGLDILVNNAGVGVYGDAEKTTIEDFRAVMEVNFFGALRCSLEALPALKEAGRGLIMNIASVAALRGIPYLAAYGASKAALASLGQSLRAELGAAGLDVMVVYPNYTRTALFLKEKRVGGARRPASGYADPAKVATAIVRAVEKGRNELVLSAEGRALKWVRSLFPAATDKAMERIAARLREPGEVCHE